MLSREQLVNRKRTVKTVPVLGYDNQYVRTLTLNESLALDAAIKASGDDSRTSAFIIAARLCDENGKQILDQPGDENLVGEIDTPIASAVLDVINAETPKNVEAKAEQAKN